jgi:hypothetical protein
VFKAIIKRHRRWEGFPSLGWEDVGRKYVFHPCPSVLSLTSDSSKTILDMIALEKSDDPVTELKNLANKILAGMFYSLLIAVFKISLLQKEIELLSSYVLCYY